MDPRTAIATAVIALAITIIGCVATWILAPELEVSRD